MKIDWASERQLFPAVTKQTYLLTAAVGPISTSVYSSYQNHYKSLLENGDVNWIKNIDMLEQVRAKTAQFLGSNGDHEIAFTANTSLAMNLLALIFKTKLQNQSRPLRVLSCKEEFPSTTVPWLHHGFEVIQVPACHLVSKVEELKPALVVASAVQFGTGYRQNLHLLGEVCHNSGVELIVNATQAMGAFPIHVKEMKIVALTASCYKWMCCGYGLNVVYLSENLLPTAQWPIAGWLSVEDPLAMNNRNLKLKKQASALEVGIPMFSLLAALGTQIEYIQRLGIDYIAKRILEVSSYAYELLAPNFKVISQRSSTPELNSCDSGTLLFEVDNAESVVEQLNRKKIYVSIRQGGIRVSSHFYNNEQDINRLMEGLKVNY